MPLLCSSRRVIGLAKKAKAQAHRHAFMSKTAPYQVYQHQSAVCLKSQTNNGQPQA